MPVTVVFLHAHPDDEALLTGGTMARLAAQGHRVVLVTATDGAAGLAAAATGQDGSLAAIRADELNRAAAVLGVSRTVRLDYGDSGLDGLGTPSITGAPPSVRRPFVQVPVEQSAARVAQLLEQEAAAVLVGYDSSGGYGHPDHIRVHHVARAAARLAGTPLLLEATRPRAALSRTVRAAYGLRGVVPALAGLDVDAWRTAYTPKARITHRIDVRPWLEHKRAALAAHASQATADDGARTIEVLLRLPKPVFKMLMGTEWFAGPYQGRTFYADPLATLNRREPN
ncbi:MAG: PIG-L family deacetylase [Actinomycetes bacterium]